MKRIGSLLVALCLVVTILTGCEKNPVREEYNTLDTGKAAEVAMEYMTTKYGDKFELSSCEKKAEYTNYIYFGKMAKVWLEAEFTVKGDDTEQKYKVSMFLDEEDKITYHVAWDNYMRTIADPFLLNGINDVLKANGIEEYISYINYSSQGIAYRKGFSSDFPVLTEDDIFKDIVEQYELGFDYWIEMPKSVYEYNIENTIRNAFKNHFIDDSVLFTILVYPDEVYQERKSLHNSEESLPILLKDRFDIVIDFGTKN